MGLVTKVTPLSDQLLKLENVTFCYVLLKKLSQWCGKLLPPSFFSCRDMDLKNGVGYFWSFLWHRGPSIFTREASFVANFAHIGELITITQVPNRSQEASYAPWWIVSWIQTVLTSGTCLNQLLEWFGTWVVVINSPIWVKFATKLACRVKIEGPRCHKKD